MYDLIILGGSFTAAGILAKKDNCLVIERNSFLDGDFINALNFGSDYDCQLESNEAKELFEKFKNRNAFSQDRICLFDCAIPLYDMLKDEKVLLGTEIINIENKGDYFEVTAFNNAGYSTFKAKKIVDTRIIPDCIKSKTYNILIDGTGELPNIADTTVEPWGFNHNYVIKCGLALSDSYTTARAKVKEIVEQLPTNHKLVLSATNFDYQLTENFKSEENGIYILPAKAFKNPLLAFDKGVLFAEGGAF